MTIGPEYGRAKSAMLPLPPSRCDRGVGLSFQGAAGSLHDEVAPPGWLAGRAKKYLDRGLRLWRPRVPVGFGDLRWEDGTPVYWGATRPPVAWALYVPRQGDDVSNVLLFIGVEKDGGPGSEWTVRSELAIGDGISSVNWTELVARAPE